MRCSNVPIELSNDAICSRLLIFIISTIIQTESFKKFEIKVQRIDINVFDHTKKSTGIFYRFFFCFFM